MANCNINHYNSYDYFPHCYYMSEKVEEREIERVQDIQHWLKKVFLENGFLVHIQSHFQLLSR